MKVRHFSYSSQKGGAFSACDRLDRALLKHGLDSAVITAESIERGSAAVPVTLENVAKAAVSALWASALGSQTYVSNTLFSMSVQGTNAVPPALVDGADILHLHWVTFLLNMVSLRSLADLGAPLVWTLHDANPFTGGCHYAAGCEGFAEGCPTCPQITQSESGWTAYTVSARRKALSAFSGVVVTAPSDWLLRQARRSPVFAGYDFRVMKNCIPEAFHARNRAGARAQADIAQDEIAVLLTAIDLTERRKGMQVAIDALGLAVRALERAGRHKLVSRLRLVTLGQSSDDVRRELARLGLPLREFSYLSREDEIAAVYRACDFVLLPSLEDNFPNIITEAAACGATVLGLPRTGPGEIIPQLEVGAVSRADTAEAYAALIVDALTDVEAWRARAMAATETIARDFGEDAVGRDFSRLYEECRARRAEDRRGGPASEAPPSPAIFPVTAEFAAWASGGETVPEAAPPAPILSALHAASLPLGKQVPARLTHTPEGARIVLCELVDLDLAAPGMSVFALVSNTASVTVNVRLHLGDRSGPEVAVAPGHKVSLRLPLEVSWDSPRAQLAVLARPTFNYGLLPDPVDVSDVALLGTPESDDGLPLEEALTRSRTGRTPLAVRSNIYAPEIHCGHASVWLGPDRETKLEFLDRPGRSGLLLVHSIEKFYHEGLDQLVLAGAEDGPIRPIDIFPMRTGQVSVFEWTRDEAATAGRALTLVTPAAVKERAQDEARSLSLMVTGVVALSEHRSGGVALLKSEAPIHGLAWTTRARLSSAPKLSSDGFLYLEADGLVMATGEIDWTIETDFLSAASFDLATGCWLGRSERPIRLDFTVDEAGDAVRVSGRHSFAEACVFRGVSFKLREPVTPDLRAALQRSRVDIDFASGSRT